MMYDVMLYYEPQEVTHAPGHGGRTIRGALSTPCGYEMDMKWT